MRKLPYLNKKLPFPRDNSGQALLVILLIMAVALTIGLSITSRSITDIKISELSEEGARAFSAAEAGIEEALLAGSEGTFEPAAPFETGATYQSVSTGFGSATQFALPATVSQGQVPTLWLSNYSDLSPAYNQDRLELFWGNPGENAALEASIYYKDGTEYKVAKFALDPITTRTPANSFCNPPSCSGVISFSDGDSSFDSKNFDSKATLDLSSITGPGKTLLFARIRVLYADEQALGVKAACNLLCGASTLPSQGLTITSKGTAGAATRKVQVVKYHPAPPAFFDSVLYSQTDLEK